MKRRYEVYLGRHLLLGMLTVDGDKYEYVAVEKTISKVSKTVILHEAVKKSYDGGPDDGPIQFFKSHIETSDKESCDMYRLAEVSSFQNSGA